MSTVADAIGRTGSDGLMYVGATWASQRAKAIIDELVAGVISPEVESWLAYNDGKEPMDYIASEWFIDSVKAGTKRMQQGAADRGTIVNQLWDELNNGVAMEFDDAIGFVIQKMDEEAEAARLSRIEYEFAVEQGLIDKSDKSAKPKRGYQCELSDVVPYASNLIQWFNSKENVFIPDRRQVFLSDDDSLVCGTCDDIGTWHGLPAVSDLKTSTSAQPKPYNRAQIAKYWQMLGGDANMLAMNIIVTPEGVYPRVLTTQGIIDGLADFDDALRLLRRQSMKGSFKSASQSNKLEGVLF